jgi:hypothetical protein
VIDFIRISEGRIGRFFKKKLCKKLLIPPAFERPNFGPSKAGGGKKVFCGAFFQKSDRLLDFTKRNHACLMKIPLFAR